MAIKHICDRCGAEINPSGSKIYCSVARRFGEYGAPTELCVSCGKKLQDFLKPLPICAVPGEGGGNDGK